jgi:hypothetical protein
MARRFASCHATRPDLRMVCESAHPGRRGSLGDRPNDGRRPGSSRPTGGEPVNHDLYAWCQRERITFTRSRPYQKNDRAHLEQKNGAIVRPLIGYDRYASKAAYAQLARVYDLARLHINFFQPVQQLVPQGAPRPARASRVRPRAELRVTSVLPARRRQELEAVYQRLNPLHLRRQLEMALERLWTLAVPPGSSPTASQENTSAGG